MRMEKIVKMVRMGNSYESEKDKKGLIRAKGWVDVAIR